MKAKIRMLDPTGTVADSMEINLSVIIPEETRENGYYDEVQPDGTVFQFEPMRQFRYFLEIGDFTYRINRTTGELTLIKKGED